MFPEIAFASIIILISLLAWRLVRKKRTLFTPNEKLLIAYCQNNQFDKFVDHFEKFKINPNATDYVFYIFFSI